MAPLAGNLVGHYQILCQVGAGGMGMVFKAFDTTLQRTVALKFLTPNPINPIDRDALLREAPAASTLDHKISVRFTPSRKLTINNCFW